MIYIHALGGDLLHLIHTATVRTKRVHVFEIVCPFFCRGGPFGEIEEFDMLHLLPTCRLIYTEATRVLYSTSTFGIFEFSSLSVFCDFAQQIGADRLEMITSMCINRQVDGDIAAAVLNPDPNDPRRAGFLVKWKRTWEVFATRMPGLREVNVRLTKRYEPRLKPALEEEWVKPMLEVRGLRKFEFDLSQEVDAWESTAEYNRKLEWFQQALREALCSPR